MLTTLPPGAGDQDHSISKGTQTVNSVPSIDREVIITALVSALVVLASNPKFEAEERQVREALEVMGVMAVSATGDPI